MRIQLIHRFEDIISIDNLLSAWEEFLRGKRGKEDVQEFAANLFDNILQLHADLANKAYKHGGYHNFNISDPKPRNISKASVRDRLVHHAIFRILYPFFDRTFIHDSYSCRKNKGAHKAINRLKANYNQVSLNDTKGCYVLKCDIKKFFASIDHNRLIEIIRQYISDPDIVWLLEQIIKSFHATTKGVGLPLGNLTSQLLVNVYMNEFDQFVKHKLKQQYYTRYADDFIFLSRNRQLLAQITSKIQGFLHTQLKLTLHPRKIVLQAYSSGVDFLGWIHFPNHRVLRTATKKRMMRRIHQSPVSATVQSYLGLLQHGNAHKLEQELLNGFWLSQQEV